MGDGQIILKTFFASLFNEDLSNEPKFGRIFWTVPLRSSKYKLRINRKANFILHMSASLYKKYQSLTRLLAGMSLTELFLARTMCPLLIQEFRNFFYRVLSFYCPIQTYDMS